MAGVIFSPTVPFILFLVWKPSVSIGSGLFEELCLERQGELKIENCSELRR